jgi:hypothetical protein
MRFSTIWNDFSKHISNVDDPALRTSLIGFLYKWKLVDESMIFPEHIQFNDEAALIDLASLVSVKQQRKVVSMKEGEYEAQEKTVTQT